MASARARSGTSLSFDIVYHLLNFTSIIDLVNLCCTCKALRIYLREDSIWRRVSAPYGARDFTHFGGASPIAVYTTLLHPYGPLLGLWASDYPYRGNLLEFRLICGDEYEQGGIIGEVWSFNQTDETSSEEPVSPTYIRAVKISFEADEADEEGLESNEGSPTPSLPSAPQVRVFCDGGPFSECTRHNASLILRPNSCSRHRVKFHNRPLVLLPEFPLARTGSPWYDDDYRRLPRLPQAAPEVAQDHTTIVSIYPAARLPVIYVSPSPLVKPPAISIQCSRSPQECPRAALHVPPLPCPSLDDTPPRYYPVKYTVLPGVDPRAETWTPGSMTGLWYSSYGLNGLEMLYIVSYDALPNKQVIATKVTGDVHVPRGSVSWIFSVMDEGDDAIHVARDKWTALYSRRRQGVPIPYPIHILRGRDTENEQGFW